MAYGKFKMGRGDGRKTGAPVKPKDEMEGSRKGGGRMYTGGTPNFDERTGQYRGKEGKSPRDLRFKPPFERGGPRKPEVPGRKPIIGRKPAPGNGKRPVKPATPKVPGRRGATPMPISLDRLRSRSRGVPGRRVGRPVQKPGMGR